jgi:quercetin dioxygenase-like cupin family protein
MSSPPILRKSLLAATLNGPKAVTQVQAAQISLPPRQIAGRHRHSMPVVGYVTAGAISFQVEGEPIHTLRSGDAFYEPPNTVITHFDNASDNELAIFVAFYLKGPEDQALIEMLADKP